MNRVNDFDHLVFRNFAVRQNRQVSDPEANGLGHPGANRRGHHQHGRVALFFNRTGTGAQRAEKPLRQARLEHHVLVRAGLLQHVVQQLFQSRVQGDHGQAVFVVHQALHDHATELGPDDGGQLIRVLRAGAGLGQRLNDGAHVADRHRLAQHVLQRAGDHAQ